jgi:hypothetical protein
MPMNEQFRVGKLTTDEFKEAKELLDASFAPLAEVGKRGSAVTRPSVMKELEDNKYQIGELIVTVINEQITVANPLPLIVDEVSTDWRNDYVWTEIQKSLRVDERSPGSKPLSQLPFSWSEYGMETTQREVAVEVPLETIAKGTITASMVTEVIATGVLRERITRITNALSDAITAIPDRTGVSGYNLRYSGFTQANVDKAIDGLFDESDTATAFGRYITLEPALRAFTVSAGISDRSLGSDDAMFERGVIGVYHGCRFVAVRDQFSKVWGNQHLLSKSLVWMVGAQKGAIYMTQDLSFLDWSELNTKNASFGTGFRFIDGLLVQDPYRYRIFDV